MSANPANPAETQPKQAPAAKRMRLRYKATCQCGLELPPGEKAVWNPDTRVMLCVDCAATTVLTRGGSEDQTGSPAPEMLALSHLSAPEAIVIATPDAEMLVGQSVAPVQSAIPSGPTVPTPRHSTATFTLRSPATCACGTALTAGTDAAWDGEHQAIRCLSCLGPAAAPARSRGIKTMKLTRSVVCPCGGALAIGDRGGWHQETKTMLCPRCAKSWAQPPSADDALPDLPVDPGVPGGSAQKEYERRLAGHRKKVRAAHPMIGRLLLRFGDQPTEITSWQSGATGERRLAKKLSGLGDLALCLHDRRVPRSRANLDHVVIGQAGIYVIDAKLYADAAVDVRRADARNKLAADQLRVSGKDGTKLISAMSWQIAAVRTALDVVPEFVSVPVIPILCFIEGTFPKWVPAEGNVDIANVKVRGLYGAGSLVLSDGPYDLIARNRLLQHLARELPAK